jgi:predicted dehydrogenase
MLVPIPVAVVGCGHLGTFHARLYRELPGADLRTVCDILPERARVLGEMLGVPWTTDLTEALRGVRAVSVATPTVAHAAVAGQALEAGCSVLVEKPITADHEEAERLIRLAAARGVVLAVGHVERFNPAFRAARERVGAIRFVEAHRLSTFVPRSLDVDVILDLMIHDLDLVLALADRPVERVDAVGVPVLTTRVDIANARITFAGGIIANLTASRVSRERVRKIRLFGERRYLSADLAARKVEEVVLEDAPAGPATGPDAGTVALLAAAASSVGEPDPADDTAGDGSPLELLAWFQARRLRLRADSTPFAEANPLEDELRDFLAAVDGAALEGASGEDGLRALALAFSVRDQVQDSLRRMGIEPAPA